MPPRRHEIHTFRQCHVNDRTMYQNSCSLNSVRTATPGANFGSGTTIAGPQRRKSISALMSAIGGKAGNVSNETIRRW
jgi:hypothetical protein